MATKKNQEIKALSIEELAQELEAAQVELQKMKFNNSVTGLDNPKKIKETRRDIARIKTELRVREINDLTPEELEGRSKIRNRRRNA